MQIVSRACIVWACSLILFSGGETFGVSSVVYKPMRPPMDLNVNESTPQSLHDLKTLPDPFLSYLVSKGRNDAALRKQEKKKREAAELKLAKLKEAAAEELRRMREPRTELQKLKLHQLLLTAIIESPEVEWAMLRDEKGMGYILKKGTAIGVMGGRVAKISGSGKKVIIKEPYLEKEIHIKYKSVVIELPDEVFE